MTLKNNRAPLLGSIKLCASFHDHIWIQTGVAVQKRAIWVKIDGFFSRVTLKFDLWPWSFAWTSLLSLVITTENVMMIPGWEHSQKGRMDGRTESFIELLGCSKNNRESLLSIIKCCASCYLIWIQTGVTVRKQLTWVFTCDLCLCPFA